MSILESHHQNITCYTLQNETEIHKTYTNVSVGMPVCIKHQNFALKLKAFRKVGIAVTQNSEVDIQLLTENNIIVTLFHPIVPYI